MKKNYNQSIALRIMQKTRSHHGNKIHEWLAQLQGWCQLFKSNAQRNHYKENGISYKIILHHCLFGMTPG